MSKLPVRPRSYLGFFLRPEYRPEVAPPVRGPLPFTLGDIKRAIPAQCFEPSMFWSWFYIARDLVQFAAVAVVAYLLLWHVIPPHMTVLRGAVWTLYSIAQGSTGFGIWVIAHECGHQAYFGDLRLLNDTVGFIVHSFFLAPYHSWRITHGTHHRYTNHKDKDTAFPPRACPGSLFAVGEFFPPVHALLLAQYLVLGWPFYLLFNLEGQRPYFVNSHFRPGSMMFRPHERHLVVLSGLGVAAMLALLGKCASMYGVWLVALWYGFPWVVTSALLVLVTFLQHADKRAPHYEEDDQFEFLKGALATVDRNYGLWNVWMHHITDAHVVHHLFSHMPFYHAKVATPYVKAVCGNHYLYDDRPLPVQLWESWFVHQSSFLHSKKWKAA